MPSIMTLQGRMGGPSAPRSPQLLGVADQVTQHPILTLFGLLGASYLAYRAAQHHKSTSIAGLAGAISRDAKACISSEIATHCRKKPGRCAGAKERKQAIAIGYSICRASGFRSIAAAKR